MSRIDDTPQTELGRWMKASAETDATLSEKLGVSRVQVLRLRRNINRPSRRTAIKLEEITGIPAARLIFEEAS